MGLRALVPLSVGGPPTCCYTWLYKHTRTPVGTTGLSPPVSRRASDFLLLIIHTHTHTHLLGLRALVPLSVGGPPTFCYWLYTHAHAHLLGQRAFVPLSVGGPPTCCYIWFYKHDPAGATGLCPPVRQRAFGVHTFSYSHINLGIYLPLKLLKLFQFITQAPQS